MKTAKLIMTAIWSGCFGGAISLFIFQGNWAMVMLIIGLLVALFWLVLWIIDCILGRD